MSYPDNSSNSAEPDKKEVLALLRILDLNYNVLVGRSIRVFTRHSTLAWLFRSPGLQGRLGQWAALLSPWTLEVTKCTKGEDEILGAIAASITPRSDMDDALIAITPKKEPRRKIQAPIPTVRADEELLVISFDGSARVKRSGGAYSAILWKLPEWSVVKARSGYAERLTVNEAEYHGLLLGFDLLDGIDRGRLVVCGDSNLVMRQVRGEIDCKAPKLTLLKQEVLDQLRKWPDHEMFHVKRDWNGSADSLASATLQREGGVDVEDDADHGNLVTLNRLDEILVVRSDESIARLSPMTTRSGTRSRPNPTVMQEEFVRGLRIDRIRRAQDEESWSRDEVRSYGNIAADYEIDGDNLLFHCPPSKRSEADRDGLMRLVAPETLHQDILNHYHSTLEGGHQGIGRTYQRIRDHFHWGESPGNIQATYPFQIIAMDHIPSLPKSYKGNTELLTIAESYEECVFRRFGTSEVIRHDREPGFMADFFRAFNKILALKMFVDDLDQRDWDEYAERLTFAINTAQDRVRGDSPFYLVHGWDPRSTLEATIPFGSTRTRGRNPRRRRYRIQRHYDQARSQVNARLREAIADRADRHNEEVRPHSIEAGSQLAHLWHGPFCVAEKVNEYTMKLQVAVDGDIFARIPKINKMAKIDSVDQDRQSQEGQGGNIKVNNVSGGA
ncbi:hypothetical protein PHYSODRAFT_335121 [Phytophthora sojae]|uniref:Uncharacterized protein n=1 Tax=Phytophthora sojae (strain P6497) TaxID=1094619 RepID=G4ZU72_PHYSP|nr:hypothetical protein PHYSODRAFT_335121 [Phytophthora sojae]EGZ13346.1 hypothetical protein PHYSODRAFT_335121 [Phytophthora sojae]|eukprot:XP_009530775.1 hypothetical protein PHYSODRAFT_335121 [Phytophthora sojae]